LKSLPHVQPRAINETTAKAMMPLTVELRSRMRFLTTDNMFILLVRSKRLFPPRCEQHLPAFYGSLIFGRAPHSSFLRKEAFLDDHGILVRVRTIEHAERVVKTLLLQQVFVSHVLGVSGALLRFDLEGFSRREHGLDSILAKLFKINERRTAVSCVLFVRRYRQLVRVDQRVADLVEKDEPRRVKHHVVGFLVVVTVALEIAEKVFHQLVAHGHRAVFRFVIRVHLAAVLRTQKYVVRQNESLVQSVGGALEQLIAFYLAVNFDVPRVRDRFVLGNKITFIFLLVFRRCRRRITAGFVAGRRCARFRLSVLNGCLVAMGRANTPYYHEQNAQNQTKVYEISLHRT